jgi:hypothetical protein
MAFCVISEVEWHALQWAKTRFEPSAITNPDCESIAGSTASELLANIALNPVKQSAITNERNANGIVKLLLLAAA